MKRHEGGRSGASRARYASSSATSTRASAPGPSSTSPTPTEREGRSELRDHLGIAELVGFGLGDDDDVERRLDASTTVSEHLAREPFDSIAHNCVSNSLARRYPESRHLSGRGMPDHNEVRRMSAGTYSL